MEYELIKFSFFERSIDHSKLLWKLLLALLGVEEKLMLWVENKVLNLLVKRVFSKKKIVVLLVINVDQKRFNKVSLIQ